MRHSLSIFALCAAALPSAAQDDLSLYVNPEVVPVRELDATDAFLGLTQREKLYAHWMSVASWEGARITFAQVSDESPAILDLILHVFAHDPRQVRIASSKAGVTDAEMTAFELYAARFLSNCGNYLSFGDTKFIPSIPADRFALIARTAASVGHGDGGKIQALLDACIEDIYSLDADQRALGLGEAGTSGYYGSNVVEEDVERMKRFNASLGIEAWNTRLFKDEESRTLILKIASITDRAERRGEFEGWNMVYQYGDFGAELAKVNAALEKAHGYAANDEQREMVRDYIRHFQEGHISLHKDAMRHWVRDQGPVVETNLGFIETYRDPIHVRAEWEGFVSMVNKEQSAKLGVLVDAAPVFIPLLPWGAAFEKDTFRRPDFTSLDVLAFANSGIPAGINIPNYDEIRMNDGFKNVSLGNVLRSSGKSTKRAELVADRDQELYKSLSSEAFEVQVGLHELLGHGSGKLFMELEDGTRNFEADTVNPVLGGAVSSWYKPGQTWGSVFGRLASSWEECRAESVGLFLCTDQRVLDIFGHGGDEGDDIAYINWLIMARAGLNALQFYDPETKNWGQAHMMARFAILSVLLEEGDGVVQIDRDEEGRYVVLVDRDKIRTSGHKAISDFLTKLNVYKATADIEHGKAMYDHYTTVAEDLLPARDYVISTRKPRHIWVQPVTDLDAKGQVVLRTYPESYSGVIDSFLDRYGAL